MASEMIVASCTELLKSRFESFSECEKRVAEYILENPGRIIGMSIASLSQACETSRASVVRLCKRIGCSGYKELCMRLHAETSNFPDGAHTDYFYKDIHPNAALDKIASVVADNSIRTIKNTIAALDSATLGEAVDAINSASRVDFYGAGCSALVSLDAQNKFLRIGKNCFASLDTHMQTLAATSLEEGSVAVIFSDSGETKDMLELALIAKKSGAKVISVTGSRRNSLSGISDISLHSVSGEGAVRSGAMGSRIGILTVVDILYSAFTASNYDAVKSKLDESTAVMKTKKNF